MKRYLVIGMTRQGKSSYVKAMITQDSALYRPCFVYDPQQEYGDYYMTDIDDIPTRVKGVGLPLYNPKIPLYKQPRCRFVGEPEQFRELCVRKVNDTRLIRGRNQIWEEATIYLKGGVPADIRDLCVSSFHDQNNIVFVFHILAKVPPDIIELTHYIVLFHTLDTRKKVFDRFDGDPLIMQGFDMQRLKPDGAPPTIINRSKRTIDGRKFNILLNKFE